MSYRANGSQQLSIFDRSLRLTRRERSFLEKSWAKVFSDEIFPAIDEERFRVLYSQNASRPNTPVNIIVGALIIKELFALSDDEIVENLMLDIHYQYTVLTIRTKIAKNGANLVIRITIIKVWCKRNKCTNNEKDRASDIHR